MSVYSNMDARFGVGDLVMSTMPLDCDDGYRLGPYRILHRRRNGAPPRTLIDEGMLGIVVAIEGQGNDLYGVFMDERLYIAWDHMLGLVSPAPGEEEGDG